MHVLPDASIQQWWRLWLPRALSQCVEGHANVDRDARCSSELLTTLVEDWLQLVVYPTLK